MFNQFVLIKCFKVDLFLRGIEDMLLDLFLNECFEVVGHEVFPRVERVEVPDAEPHPAEGISLSLAFGLGNNGSQREVASVLV